MTEVIQAAGCILWRGTNSIELALVHRPKWQDWSHPKGKLKQGESAPQAALREVLEETGMHCMLGAELPTVRYWVEGRPKEVHYWAAQATTGTFTPNDEVDAVRWLPPREARALLTNSHDQHLLDTFLTTVHHA